MADIVIDTSIIAASFFQDEKSDYIDAVISSLSTIVATAPRIFAYEVRNALLVGMRRKRITRDAAGKAFHTVKSFNIRLLDPLSYEDVFALAEKHELTFYDAAYLDLAIRQKLPLASLDKKLRHAASIAGVPLFSPSGS